MDEFVLGIDVGTGSARAGLFSKTGKAAGFAIAEISLFEPQADFAEQSSGDIWRAVCKAVKEALKTAGAKPQQINGIGFDATCSLVLQDDQHAPLCLDNEGERDVILWLDHRSITEADEITRTGDAALKSIGGVMSPEMQMPKLLWLKRNRPDIWSKLGFAYDLTDWLTWKASGDQRRSLCTTVCKWAFDTGKPGAGPYGSWPQGFLNKIGLDDLLVNDCRIIGSEIVLPGSAMGDGLSRKAALDLGLVEGTPVGAGLIDAHAGAAGVLLSGGRSNPARRMALIAGTSNCHMLLADREIEVHGIWGPYKNAILDNLWLAEGGQSAAGLFLQRLIEMHPAHKSLSESWPERFATLDAAALKMIAQKGIEKAVGNWLIVPDFAGNRSPLARSDLTGIIMGASLDQSFDDLTSLYIAGLLALAHGTRHIVDELLAAGHSIDGLVVTGSGATNALSMQLHADILGLEVVTASITDGVSLGAAMTAAAAAGIYGHLQDAMAAMSREGTSHVPDHTNATWHETRYQAFRDLQLAGQEIINRQA